MTNGFMILNGKCTPLPDDLFDTPTKEREDEIIKSITKDIKEAIFYEVIKSKAK